MTEMSKELLQALLAFHKEAPAIKRTKDGQTGNQKYKYAPLDVILDSVRPLLTKHGLLLVFAAEPSEVVSVVNVRTMLIHAESGGSMSEVISLQTEGGNAKDVGKALTYGSRYGVQTLLALAIEDDIEDTVRKKQVDTQPAKLEPEQQYQVDSVVSDMKSAPDSAALDSIWAQHMRWLKEQRVSAGVRALLVNPVAEAGKAKRSELNNA